MTSRLTSILAVLASTLFLAACQEESEDAGEAAGEAVEETGDAVEEAGEEAGDAVE